MLTVLLSTVTITTAAPTIEVFLAGCNPKLTAAAVSRITSEIIYVSQISSVDPFLLASVIAVESQCNPNAIGKTHGEVGLMQLRPEYHGNKLNLFDTLINIRTGAEYLARIKGRFHLQYNNYTWLEFYNRGPSGRRPKKFLYTRKVLNYYFGLRGTNEGFVKILATSQSQPRLAR